MVPCRAGEAGCSPAACGAQQHRGVLGVKLEEGEETFVQLPSTLSAPEVESIPDPVTETARWSVAQSVFLGKAGISFD